MDWKIYNYTISLDGNFVVSKRPLIKVVLSNNGKKMEQLATIDSGADISLLSEEVADFLGIDKEKCERVPVEGVFGEPVDGFLYQLSVLVDNFDIPVQIPIVFVKNLKSNLLLGQHGFFQKFRVKFDNKQSIFELQSVDEDDEFMQGLSPDVFGGSVRSKKKS